MNAPVLSTGIIVVDHIAAPIDRLPDAGHLVLTDDCFLSIGGCAANVAVDLAKQGIQTTICGCVGADPFGDFARHFLSDHGVDCAGIVNVLNVATSQTLIVNVKGQDRRFIHHLGANAHFTAAHMPRERLQTAKVLYVGGYFLMDRLDPNELAGVFAEAQSLGVKTVLDVVTPGPGAYLPRLAPVLPHADVFLPNSHEAELMTGLADPRAQAETFHAMGAKTAVITCGGDGVVLVGDGIRLRANAYSVPFVDGTGGGDAFDAGYIRGLLEGADPRRCLELGSALGASCVQQSGATAGVFDHSQLDAFLKSHSIAIEAI